MKSILIPSPMEFLFALHKCSDKLLRALDIFALKLSSAQIHFMSFHKQSEKNGPCFATGATSSRTAETDWHNSQKVWVLGRAMKTWDTAVKGMAEDEVWGQDTAVPRHIRDLSLHSFLANTDTFILVSTLLL